MRAPLPAQVISEDLGMKLENTELSQLGQAKKVTIKFCIEFLELPSMNPCIQTLISIFTMNILFVIENLHLYLLPMDNQYFTVDMNWYPRITWSPVFEYLTL